ncbi:MAG TPA: metallophosphoesterase family protein [Gemmata sp.]|nr:metallophosphoesterase family protein [Gemmata sp.]
MTNFLRPPLALTLAAVLASASASPAQEQGKKEPQPTKEEVERAKKAEATQRETWKTVYRPSHVPDRVVLTWNGDPATTQAVTWRTDVTVGKAVGQVALSEGGPAFDAPGSKTRPNPDKVRTVAGRTEPLTTDLFEAHYHSVVFDGLKPKTKYVYRVGDGSTWSEWFEFRTASDEPDRLSFIYFGDSQNELKSHWSRVVRGAYSDMPRANFIIHAGDLINRANADGEWGEWHEAAGWINGMIPSVPTPGNHEYAAATGSAAKVGEGDKPDPKKTPPRKLSGNWRPQFTLPENGPPGLEETVYYLDIQGVRLVSLNSNERQEEQVPWLEGVLSNNPNKWTVITFHHPIYSTAKGRDNKKLRELWRPVFDKYAPDLVLQGHDHTYGRSGRMREDNLLTGARVADEKGTVYVVSVSGPKMYKLEKAEWMQASTADTQLYQLITIDGDTLHYEARTASGALYDSFDLTKNPKADAGGASEAAAPPAWPGTMVWVALGVVGAVLAVVVARVTLRRAAA